jgi:hypothetical protein
MRIRDPGFGMEKFGFGILDNIPDFRLDSLLVDVETALESSVDTQPKADALGRVIKVMQPWVRSPREMFICE